MRSVPRSIIALRTPGASNAISGTGEAVATTALARYTIRPQPMSDGDEKDVGRQTVKSDEPTPCRLNG